MIANAPIAKISMTFLSLTFVAIFFSSSVLAQSQTTGRISGTVKDERGGLIIGAEINVTSKATGAERRVTTGNEANYNVPLLSAGIYVVKITAHGFNSTVFDSVQVAITETTIVNAELTVERVAVDPVPVLITPLIQKDGPQLGRVVDSRAVSELPLATRNFAQILALSPGASVALPDNTALGRNSQNVSVNGARVTQNDFEINGVDANNLTTNAAASGVGI